MCCHSLLFVHLGSLRPSSDWMSAGCSRGRTWRWKGCRPQVTLPSQLTAAATALAGWLAWEGSKSNSAPFVYLE